MRMAEKEKKEERQIGRKKAMIDEVRTKEFGGKKKEKMIRK